jgi:hypothetical protein
MVFLKVLGLVLMVSVQALACLALVSGLAGPLELAGLESLVLVLGLLSVRSA